MNVQNYTTRDLQNLKTLLADAMRSGYSLQAVDAAIDAVLATRLQSMSVAPPTPARRRRPDNVTTCQACGSPAVIVPLSPADRTPSVTHAIQCQNRPAGDQPWRDGMCGVTEYVLRGEK